MAQILLMVGDCTANEPLAWQEIRGTIASIPGTDSQHRRLYLAWAFDLAKNKDLNRL